MHLSSSHCINFSLMSCGVRVGLVISVCGCSSLCGGMERVGTYYLIVYVVIIKLWIHYVVWLEVHSGLRVEIHVLLVLFAHLSTACACVRVFACLRITNRRMRSKHYSHFRSQSCLPPSHVQRPQIMLCCMLWWNGWPAKTLKLLWRGSGMIVTSMEGASVV